MELPLGVDDAVRVEVVPATSVRIVVSPSPPAAGACMAQLGEGAQLCREGINSMLTHGSQRGPDQQHSPLIAVCCCCSYSTGKILMLLQERQKLELPKVYKT